MEWGRATGEETGKGKGCDPPENGLWEWMFLDRLLINSDVRKITNNTCTLLIGQWKGFLAVYAGFYVFNNIIRPLRIGISVGVAKYFDQAISMVQEKLKVSKGVAIGIVVFLANIVGTCSLMSLGIFLASLSSGVPIFPPKV